MKNKQLSGNTFYLKRILKISLKISYSGNETGGVRVAEVKMGPGL